ncbi:hypothetical protein MAR_ORF139 [Marseillevirus marseillevirus]|uniref:Uncharacterized protein n=1 Tax=Marseillevirus marseillevirus TaxID=694581 RepID=D2XAE3_GBMV|nr:hypothetical protein MAR_ORF139 [Marseillevirus marseillevirus]ADB03920.1 hypothetical protein MAR_ORF139 [Marseillevirus marseillevirus]
MDNGIIYLIRDDAIWKDGVYKVGKSSNWASRKNSYGNVRVLQMFNSDFISASEKLMISAFKEHFSVAKGNEFFLCDDEDVVLRIFLSVKEHVEIIGDDLSRSYYMKKLPFLPSEDFTQRMEFLDKKISAEDANLMCEVPVTTYDDFSFICSKKEKTKEDVASYRKFCLSHNFRIGQKLLTPEFVLEYSGKEKIFENQSLAFSGSKAEQKERLTDLLERKNEEKNEEKKELKASKRISLSCNLEKVIYGRRLFYWLGYGSTTSREKKSKEEMASRLEKIQQRAKKSRCFQELFGKVPEEKEHIVRYVNGILRKMFDCYISRTSKSKIFNWELTFCSPWIHKDEVTALPQKKKYRGTIPKTF